MKYYKQSLKLLHLLALCMIIFNKILQKVHTFFRLDFINLNKILQIVKNMLIIIHYSIQLFSNNTISFA